ncbi:MAG: hypothetical protein GC138_07520 [Gammaproteobacteria bacterium]|nr:hypothetical protein [Gammaproteobacteria bacterium]
MSGPNQRMTLSQAIKAYIERFGEGPPIFGMGNEEAMTGIIKAIASGKPMVTSAEVALPELYLCDEGYFSDAVI